MDRRDFLRVTASLTGLGAAYRAMSQEAAAARVVTVLGSIPSVNLGVTLPHEHVLVDFIGAEEISRDRYDPDEVFEIALPHLRRVWELGCQTLAECTPAYIGRDPRLLERLAKASGLQLLTNTGYYGAAGDKFLPRHAFQETADQLAEKWLREWHEGIEGTGIRPGFLKIGVDAGPLSEVDRKLVRAAARTHLASGLTIAAHTGDGMAAMEELATLKEEDLDGSALVWVHAQNERDSSKHFRAAERGAWVEFDGIRPQTIARHVELVKLMKARGFLDRVLLSHDAGWYHVGEPGGGEFRPFDALFTQFVPKLKAAGFSDEDVRQLIIDNPREAFTVRPRPAKR